MDDAERFALFTALVRHYGTEPDSRGEVHVPCPNCGKEPKRGDTHFSFGVDGGFCFPCGRGIGLKALAIRAGLDGPGGVPVPTTPPPQQKKQKPRPPWWGKSAVWYEQNFRHNQVWTKVCVDGYKKLSVAAIDRFLIGFGRVPGFADNRIIVPVFSAGGLVCIRGRALGENAGRKWVAASGFKVTDLPLFGIDLVKKDDDVVVLIENPYDVAGLWDSGVRACAFYSASYWRRGSTAAARWTAELASAVGPDTAVIVAGDHDLAGNGGGALRAEWVAQWKAERPRGQHPPAPCGPQIANMLVDAGLSVRLLDWVELGLPRKSGGWELKEKIDSEREQTAD